MDQSELEKLIEHLVKLPAENEIVEFKLNNFSPDVIGKRISALSNAVNLLEQKYGYIVFGIEDETHAVIGTKFNPHTEKIGTTNLIFWLSQHLNPRIDFRIYTIKYNQKDLVIFQVPPAITQPVKFEGVAYIRVGSATPKLNDYPDKERSIWNNINRISFEKGIAKENLNVTEILGLLDYSKYFSLTKQDLPTETQQFVEKMRQHGLVKKVFNNCYDITNLGAILFAKDLTQFPSVKRKAIRVIQYEGNTRVVRMKEYETNFGYALIFESLLDYINDKLPHNEVISRSLRKEVKMYPEVAIREFVANALIHQDLTITGAGPMIELFDNRIEITNTGEPLIDTTRFIDHPPRSRNEDMASFMRQVGICEEGGTGVDRALVNIAMYQLPAPSFETYTNFTKITMFAHKSLRDMTIDDKVRACYQHCVLMFLEKARMTNSSLRERLGIGERNYPAASAIIKDTIEKKLIKESEKPKEYIPIWA